MSVKAIIKGTIVALVLTLIFILLMSVVLYFSELDERIIEIGVYVGTAAGVITGAVGTAKGAGRKVLIHCLLMGLLYLAVMTGITLLVKGGVTLNYHFFTVIAGVMACSIFGAVIGRAGA